MSWGLIGGGAAQSDSSGYGSAPTPDNKSKGGAAGQAGDRSIKPSGKGPCAIYFCSEQLAQTAGLGTEGIRAKIKAGVKPTDYTVFDSNAVMAAFKKAGIDEFFKVSATKENLALSKKYQVTQDNTLVLCAPSGEMVIAMAGGECNQTAVLKVLKAWPEIYVAWQKKNAK